MITEHPFIHRLRPPILNLWKPLKEESSSSRRSNSATKNSAGSGLGVLLAALFFVAARRDGMQVVARVATFAACALGAVAVSLAVTLSDALWGTPAPYVWWAVGALGAIGSRTSFE